MRDIPIIFSASMVRALLREAQEEGAGKSMTRRLAWRSECPTCGGSGRISDGPNERVLCGDCGAIGKMPSPWQRATAGDRLWVRETIKGKPDDAGFDSIEYAADNFHTRIPCANDNESQERFMEIFYYRRGRGLPVPSIHMPRWASRLTLVVTETKIERLHKISRADVLAEGILPADIKKWEQWLHPDDCPGKAFGVLWDSINGKGEWDKNPEVVAVRFAVHKTNIDSMKEAA